MVERSLLIFALLVCACACDPKPAGGKRDLHLAQSNPPVDGLTVAASSSEIDVPEGIGIVVRRDPGSSAVDFSTAPTSDDPTVATIQRTSSFDVFVVAGMKPGRTTLHFTDGEPSSVPVVVTAQP